MGRYTIIKLLLTEISHCVRSIRLECQNKYFFVWTSSSVNKSITDQQQQNTQNSDIIGSPRCDETAVTEMIETIKPTWTDNYEQYIKMDVHEQKYLTKKDRKIENVEIEAAN